MSWVMTAGMLVGLTATAARGEEPQVPPSITASDRALRHVIIQTTASALPYGALAVAIAERVPGLTVQDSELGSFDWAGGQTFVYVEIRGDTASLAVTAILPDGRAFVRMFTPDPDDVVRSTAAMVANLVVAIEQETLAPSHLGAELPSATPAPGKLSEGPVKAPTRPTPTPLRVPLQVTPVPTGPADPSFGSFGLALVPDMLLRIRPREAKAVGELSLMLRLRTGLLVSLQVRYGRQASDGAALHRVRIASTVGYVWRRRQIQLMVAAGPSVEPWFVRERGQRATPRREGTPGNAVLWGGMAWLAPAWHVVPTSTRVAFDIGARAGVSISALRSGADVRVVRPDRTDLFTFGGLEANVGVWTAVWLP